MMDGMADLFPIVVVLVPVVLLLGVLAVVSAQRNAATARDQARAAERLARVEHKLDALLRHQGITVPEPELPGIIEHLRHGRKIHAIKAYRDQTGATLADAKTTVERLAAEHGL
jgi:ribosomal protein L7/L12